MRDTEEAIPLRQRPEAHHIAATVADLAAARACMLTGQVGGVPGGFSMPRRGEQ